MGALVNTKKEERARAIDSGHRVGSRIRRLPYLAKTLGARPPRHFPAWLARLFGGELAVIMGTELRAASNAKAKRELGLTLRYPSWRQGFVATYAGTTTKASNR